MPSTPDDDDAAEDVLDPALVAAAGGGRSTVGQPTSAIIPAVIGPDGLGRFANSHLQRLIDQEIAKLPEDADWKKAIVLYGQVEGGNAEAGVAFIARKGQHFSVEVGVSIAKGGKPKGTAELKWAG